MILWKRYMIAEHSDYVLVSETANTLNYQRNKPAESAGLGAVGCLSLFGFLPGLIWWILRSRDAEIDTLNIFFSERETVVNGQENYKIQRGFEKFVR